ncbi:MAG: glycosyltransferase family 39 protein, partial [Candidatus Promineifilaceae bacterium]
MKRATSPLARLGWPWIVLFLLWLAFVLAGYYVVQNAFLQPTLERIRLMAWLPAGVSAAALGRAALDLLAAGLIALAGLNLGGWLLDRLRPAGLEPAERLIFGQALGLGLLGLAVLGLGLVGLLERGILLALVLVPAGLGLRANLARLRPLAAARPPRLLLLYGLPAGVLALALALLPPTAWDGLFYHLTGPKLYLELGAIQPAADIPHLNFPFLQEMLFLLAMSIHSDRAAVLLHFLYAPLLVGLVVLFARRHFGLRNGWLAAVFLLSMPMLLSLAAWAYNDLALAFFEVGALYALLRQRQATQGAPAGAPAAGRADLILAGLLAGFGLGLKYTAVVAVVPLGLLLLRWGRRRPRLALGRLALFGLTAGLLLTPWLLKNWAFTSNPVYPFVFGGQNWDTFRAAAYAEAGTGIAYNPAGCRQGPPEHLHGQHPTGCAFDAAYLARRLLTLPYGLTLGIHDTSRDGDPGPLFLVFLPLALLYGLG